jgi:transposase
MHSAHTGRLIMAYNLFTLLLFYLSFSSVNVVTAATIIADIGDIQHYSSADKVAKLAGIAPLNHSSGNRDRQTRNRYGKRRLNKAFYFLALQHIQVDKKGNPRNSITYKQQRYTSKQEMVYVMRRLVNIIYSMMKYKTPYTQPFLPQLTEAGETC